MIRLVETDSTNNYLTKLAHKQPLEELTVVTADFQTAGKGQRGNGWESEQGKNLLFSCIFYPDFLPVRKQFLLSKVIAISIKEALEQYITGISIKWPNDIYWHNKKICGILLENELQGNKIKHCIAGIGINVNQKEFHSPAPNPISFINITGQEQDTLVLLNTIMEQIVFYYQLLKTAAEEKINRLYAQSLYRKEGFHLYVDKNGQFTARIVEVLPEGFLILEDSAGKKRNYAFKEVQFI